MTYKVENPFARAKKDDMYKVGNDYDQVPSAYFRLDSYVDGIYTDVSGAQFSGISALNKRIDVKDQDTFVTYSDNLSAISGSFSGEADALQLLSNEYATAENVPGYFQPGSLAGDNI